MQHHSSGGEAAGCGSDARTQQLGEALRACYVTRKDVLALTAVEAAVAPHGVSCMAGCVFMLAETFLVRTTGTRVDGSALFLQHSMGETPAGEVSDREVADVRQCLLESKVKMHGLTKEDIEGTARRLCLARAWAADWAVSLERHGLGQLVDGLHGAREEMPPPPSRPRPPAAGRLLCLLREIETIVADSSEFIDPENVPHSPVKRELA